MPDYTGGAILLCSDYRKTALARAVPYSYFGGDGWYLPPDPDPESARWAIRLFPHLQAEYPELVASAALSVIDHTPIDFATAAWVDRPTHADPWMRVTAAAAEHGIHPHEFQRTDADYAISRLNAGLGAYLGWEMGLGKTLGACMIVDGWPANFVFIACPNDAKQDPWVQELARFCPWITPVVIGNTAATRASAMAEAKRLMDAGEPTAVICHYAAIPLIEGANKRGWKGLGRFDLKIADEGHLHKNKMTKFTAAFRRLGACGSLFLSGSVMSGRAEDLFVPWQIMRPKRYRRRWEDWNDRFLDVIEGDYGKVIVGPALQRLPAFKAELGEMLVVRPARDYLSLPEPRIIEHALPLHPEQKRVYHQLADELLSELPDGSIQTTTDGAALLTALRRTTGGVPQARGVPQGAEHGLISTKVDKAVELCLSAGDSQVVVFVWHKALGREIARRLREAKVSTGSIDGDVSRAGRDQVVDLFKRQGYRVIVATIATLATAVNLQNASVVIMAEESFDPIDNEQAIGRVLRQGQTQSVSVHNLRCEDTVDDLAVLPTYTTKRELRRLVLGS